LLDFLARQAAYRVRDHEQWQVRHAERPALTPGEALELGRADNRARLAAPAKFNGVVDTPRRA
jgi:hypothetical protein